MQVSAVENTTNIAGKRDNGMPVLMKLNLIGPGNITSVSEQRDEWVMNVTNHCLIH